MSAPETDGLQRRAIRGGMAMAGGQVLRAATQFGGLVVLARLLQPSDFGIVAMATAIVGVSAVLSDFGLSMAIMKERDLEPRIRDQIFYINVGLALIVALAIWFSSPMIAGFYKEPRLEGITHWLAISAFLTGLAPQLRAELARKLRFKPLAYVDVVSQLVGLVVACVAAVAGARYWAVVIQQMTAALVLVLMLSSLSRYVPRSRPGFRGLRDHLSLGLVTLGTQATNYAAVNSAPAAVGKLLGAATVGLYSRSYQLASIPLVQLAAPLTRVAVPMLARTKNDFELVDAARRIQLLLAFALIPILVLLGVGGEPLVVILLGTDWKQAGDLTQILSVGGVFQVFGYVFFWIFIQKGRLAVLWSCELVSWTVVVPLFFVLGGSGSNFVAGLYACGLVLNWLLVGTIGTASIGLPVSELMGPSFRRLSWVVVTMGAGTVARELALGRDLSSIVVLAIAVLVTAASVPLLWIAPSFRYEVRSVLSIVKKDVLGR